LPVAALAAIVSSLFATYSRFIPNLTRTDGSAFDALVSNVIDPIASENRHPQSREHQSTEFRR
jgi:hypothetical protein